MVKTVQFVVKLELPEGVTKRGLADYVRDAVQCWKGGLWHGDASHDDPEAHDPDPLFLLDPTKVTVRPYCQPRGDAVDNRLARLASRVAAGRV